MVVAKHYNTTIRPDTDIWKALKQDMKTELGVSLVFHMHLMSEGN